MADTTDMRKLSPQDIKRREYEARAARADKDRILKEDDQDEMNALFNHPDATETASGKVIRRFSNRRDTIDSTDDFRGIFSSAMGSGFFIQNIKNAFNLFQETFLASASPIIVPPQPETGPDKKTVPADPALMKEYEDDECIINMERVSSRAARRLNEESAKIEEKMRELAGIADPASRRAFAGKIILLAAQYEMREHPQFPGHYIHNHTRVEREEARITTAGAPAAFDMICVYRIKFEIGDDTVKQKRNIGDVLNQDPGEVQLNENERVALEQSRPVPPPGFDLR